MSEALKRIRVDIQAFSTLLARSRTFPPTTVDLKDAYNSLSRVKDRYEHDKEKGLLEPSERAALAKVLEHDPLISEMLRIVRPIGDSFGELQPIEHMANLNEADWRLLKALDRAGEKVSQ